MDAAPFIAIFSALADIHKQMASLANHVQDIDSQVGRLETAVRGPRASTSPVSADANHCDACGHSSGFSNLHANVRLESRHQPMPSPVKSIVQVKDALEVQLSPIQRDLVMFNDRLLRARQRLARVELLTYRPHQGLSALPTDVSQVSTAHTKEKTTKEKTGESHDSWSYREKVRARQLIARRPKAEPGGIFRSHSEKTMLRYPQHHQVPQFTFKGPEAKPSCTSSSQVPQFTFRCSVAKSSCTSSSTVPVFTFKRLEAEPSRTLSLQFPGFTFERHEDKTSCTSSSQFPKFAFKCPEAQPDQIFGQPSQHRPARPFPIISDLGTSFMNDTGDRSPFGRLNPTGSRRPTFAN
ncbi:hypothetical protein BU24DRAFT_466194 [Aaosphaeria arxii CBS 175.79]|uniref:Uncharacterized protein n=1 Tax=Aaosphaeria arxii CBS 175.79 TaxID=1450172 RepID=A0A6A5XEY9_9PLEO|nr:uncharacterized protein BU24DRAFT_466194 [Aaosphaeria arxii CBS 175.79]KAF2011493.1 hypothetical protein BU24DRAFT_466194 [Aaosphaeria arxii CBS 175.79]